MNFKKQLEARDRYLGESGIVPFVEDISTEGLTREQEVYACTDNAVNAMGREAEMRRVDEEYARLSEIVQSSARHGMIMYLDGMERENDEELQRTQHTLYKD